MKTTKHNTYDSDLSTNFVGFSTASGTKFNISKDSLKKAKNIFGEDLHVERSEKDPPKNDNTVVDNVQLMTNVSNAKFDGFSTASGTNINVPEGSLKKAKNVFGEDLKVDITDYVTKTPEIHNEDSKTNESISLAVNSMKQLSNEKFNGFSTAKGTKFNISEESFKQAKNIFGDEFLLKGPENDLVESEPFSDKSATGMKNLSNGKFSGFSSAKGTKFNISEESLKKVKNMFVEEFNPIDKENNIKESENLASGTTKFNGFSTATGTKFNISAESLKKARNIFDEQFQQSDVRKNIDGNCLKENKISLNDLPSAKFDKFNPSNASKVNLYEESTKEPINVAGQEIKDKEIVGQKIERDAAMPSQENSDMKNLSNCNEAFEDDFIVDTQVLQDVERMALQNSQPNVMKPRCKIIGIPLVDSLILENRSQMRNKQVKVVKACNEVYEEGSISKTKRNISGKIQLKDLEEINCYERYAGKLKVTETALNMTAELARDHVFVGRHYFNEDILTQSVFIELGDGAKVVLNDASNIDLEAITHAFRNSPGVNGSKVTEDWVKNHYRWIIWKLASLERRFPNRCAGLLHPNTALLQLRYRYDKEINGQSRSALRKIYEKDDIPSKCLVLVVADMKKLDDGFIYLELSDGWYSIGCKVDQVFSKLVIGTKLVTFGAELTNHDEACTPLEAPNSSPEQTKLKIHFNSTRRARWDTKLGYHNFPSLPTSLNKLVASGGCASELTLYLARKYPIVYQMDSKKYISQRNYDSLKIDQDLEQIYQEVQQGTIHILRNHFYGGGKL